MWEGWGWFSFWHIPKRSISKVFTCLVWRRKDGRCGHQGSAKCWIWVRIFSGLAPIDVSASYSCFFHRYGNPVNEKKKEGKPQPHILTVYGRYILFIAHPQTHLDSCSQNVRKGRASQSLQGINVRSFNFFRGACPLSTKAGLCWAGGSPVVPGDG